MSQKHAELSPSKSSRWIACPGSIALSREAPPQETSSYAQEGTAQHTVAENCLRKERDPKDFLGVEIDGISIDQDHVEVVQEYLSLVFALRDEFPDAKESVEDRVAINDEIYGTLDYSLSEQFNVLVILDLKTGVGVSVDPATSTQLRIYAVAKAGDELETYEKIILIISQPRDKYGHTVKRHEMTAVELIDWRDNVLFPAIENVKKAELGDDSCLVPGEEQCRWCPAKPLAGATETSVKCHKLADFSMQSALDDFGELIDPLSLSNDEIGEKMKDFPLIQGWMAAISQYAINEIKVGHKIPGWKLVKGRAHRQWKEDDDTKIARVLRRFKLKAADVWTKKIISPAQAEKVVAKTDHEKLKKHIIKPEGSPVLVKESDKRPALSTMADAKSDFNDLGDDVNDIFS